VGEVHRDSEEEGGETMIYVEVSKEDKQKELIEGAQKMAKTMNENPNVGYVMGGNDEILILMVRWPK
jgi:hypothetical protein